MKYSKLAISLGITQIVLGCLAFLFEVIACFIYGGPTFLTGIYAGVFFIVTGAFGIAAGMKKSKCLLITCMILSIISCAMVLNCLGMLATQIIGNRSSLRYRYDGYPDATLDAVLVMSCIILIISFVEGIIAIIQSAFACVDICCKNQPQAFMASSLQPQVVYVQQPVQTQ